MVYDRLVSDDIMNLVTPPRCRPCIRWKTGVGYYCVPQEEINQILLREAQKGKRVVRLKGGDPFIFGRGGEELETLCDAGIPFSVVPGITAASGCLYDFWHSADPPRLCPERASGDGPYENRQRAGLA